MRAAVRSIEEFIARAPEGSARHEAAIVLQRLKAQLN
jgi:hypothetical protein